jgi:hypothetical protein
VRNVVYPEDTFIQQFYDTGTTPQWFATALGSQGLQQVTQNPVRQLKSRVTWSTSLYRNFMSPEEVKIQLFISANYWIPHHKLIHSGTGALNMDKVETKI